jgi:hypothetical protein
VGICAAYWDSTGERYWDHEGGVLFGYVTGNGSRVYDGSTYHCHLAISDELD